MPRTAAARIRAAYDQRALKRFCETDETAFGRYGTRRAVDQHAPADYLYHRDNGSSILAVAHLDTVSSARARTAHFADTAAGPVIHSRALDDRLGAYIICDLLPKLGIRTDVLLTVGEESGQSTAGAFEPDKQYDWMIEFDRGGTDVVLYQYEDYATAQLVRGTGAHVGRGSFSDISYLEHLGCKGFNWGVGYQDYHGPRAHAYLNDTFLMVERFLALHDDIAGVALPHGASSAKGGTSSRYNSWYGTDDGDWWSPKGEWAAWEARQLDKLDKGATTGSEIDLYDWDDEPKVIGGHPRSHSVHDENIPY